MSADRWVAAPHVGRIQSGVGTLPKLSTGGVVCRRVRIEELGFEGTKTTMDTAAEFGSTFGCGYCRDPRNRRSGKITEVSRFAGAGTILLRCPQCTAHYVVNDDRTITTRITDSEAASLLKQVGTSDP
jgi:hypothetical protein